MNSYNQDKQLRPGWLRIRLGDVTEPSKEKVNPQDVPSAPYIGLEHIEKETGRLLGYGNSDEVRSTKSVFHPGDLLYGKLRPYLNKVYVPDFEGICSTDILVFPKSDIFSNKFIYYRFLSGDFVRFANQNVSGVQHPRVSPAILAEFEIDLPPLTEQERIVAKIEELFTQLEAGVAELQQAKAKLQRYRQAVLKSAVEGELTRDWREAKRIAGDSPESAAKQLTRILSERRAKWDAEGGKGKYKEPVPPDTDDLPELPEGWVWVNLDSLITLSQNGFGKRRSKTGTPTIVLRLADIANGSEISLDDVRRIGATEEEIERYRLLENDLICIRVNGSPNLVGRFVRFESAPEVVTFCDHFIRFRLANPKLASYLEYYCNSQLSRRYVDLNKVSSAGQNTVSQATMKELVIALPPMKEQVRLEEMVERRLSVADEIEKELDQALARSERLRQSILKLAFEGELVVGEEFIA